MFSISDKVVCVDFAPEPPRPGMRYSRNAPKGGSLIEPSRVYVIREVWQSLTGGGELIQLVGIPDYFTGDGKKIGFNAWRFRKLADLRTENASALCANGKDEPRARCAE